MQEILPAHLAESSSVKLMCYSRRHLAWHHMAKTGKKRLQITNETLACQVNSSVKNRLPDTMCGSYTTMDVHVCKENLR